MDQDCSLYPAPEAKLVLPAVMAAPEELLAPEAELVLPTVMAAFAPTPD